MMLKSFGCSFIYGSELKDDDGFFYSRLTWPALLAEKLGYVYQCFARPGTGNLHTLNQILNQVALLPPEHIATFVIGWTWADRYDYVASDSENWQTIMPTDTTELSKTYYKHLHSQYSDKLLNLIYMKTAIDVLKQRGMPFVMTCIDDVIFKDDYHQDTAIEELREYVKPHITWFEGTTFLKWTEKNGWPISAKLHPLELAHQRAADYISVLIN